MFTYAGMTFSARAGEGFPDGGTELNQRTGGRGGPEGDGGASVSGGGNVGGAAEDNHSTSDESMSEEEGSRKFVPPISNPVIVSKLCKLPFSATNLNGVKGQFGNGVNPSDVLVFPTNFNSVGKLAGQTDSIIGSYNAVAALRKVDRTNPRLSEGGRQKPESSQIGSFKTKGDGRFAICHFMTLVEKKQNISFSFDPKTWICSSCNGRGGGGHPVGGGGVETRQVFVLMDQNFPAVLPCSMGECLKIIRVEDGGLNEIVSVWLDITKGRDFPAGSVVVLASASHLTLHGVGGYIPDLASEFS
jgi:hypothetical protein